MMDSKEHWEKIYRTKSPTDVSWYQEHPRVSLEYFQNLGLAKDAQIIDVGGGASRLVDDLLSEGFLNITVLDISSAALEAAQKRLGAHAGRVKWIDADIRNVQLPERFYDAWHDRAVFHFLTEASDRQQYIDTVQSSVKPGGYVIVATFAPEGPRKCSGLNVVRYGPKELHSEFGDNFQLVNSRGETHLTPFGTEQQFLYCCCLKRN
jgi:ubiquinone/menaquinone biosynthesis C-methylase UbiE